VTAGGLMALEVTNFLRAESDQEKLEVGTDLLIYSLLRVQPVWQDQSFDLSWETGGFIWSKVSMAVHHFLLRSRNRMNNI